MSTKYLYLAGVATSVTHWLANGCVENEGEGREGGKQFIRKRGAGWIQSKIWILVMGSISFEISLVLHKQRGCRFCPCPSHDG